MTAAEWLYLSIWVASMAALTVVPLIGGLVILVKVFTLARIYW